MEQFMSHDFVKAVIKKNNQLAIWGLRAECNVNRSKSAKSLTDQIRERECQREPCKNQHHPMLIVTIYENAPWKVLEEAEHFSRNRLHWVNPSIKQITWRATRSSRGGWGLVCRITKSYSLKWKKSHMQGKKRSMQQKLPLRELKCQNKQLL